MVCLLIWTGSALPKKIVFNIGGWNKELTTAYSRQGDYKSLMPRYLLVVYIRCGYGEGCESNRAIQLPDE